MSTIIISSAIAFLIGMQAGALFSNWLWKKIHRHILDCLNKSVITESDIEYLDRFRIKLGEIEFLEGRGLNA